MTLLLSKCGVSGDQIFTLAKITPSPSAHGFFETPVGTVSSRVAIEVSVSKAFEILIKCILKKPYQNEIKSEIQKGELI